MTGHGSVDGKRTWFSLKYGERFTARNIDDDELPFFLSGPVILGIVGVFLSLGRFCFGAGTPQHMAIVLIAMSMVLGFVLFIVSVQGPDPLVRITWREYGLLAGVCLACWVYADKGYGGFLALEGLPLVGLLLLVPLVSYGVLAVRRYIWEPLAAALLFLAPFALVIAGIADTFVAAILLMAIAFGSFFGLRESILYDKEQYDYGMRNL